MSDTQKQLEQAAQSIAHIKNGAAKAMSRALNRASDMAKTDVVQKTSDDYIIKQSRVRKTVSVKRSSASTLTARVTSKDGSLGLENFKVSPARPSKAKKKPVVRVQVRRDGGLKALPRAFVAKMQSGHIAIFERAGKSRLPIEKKFGPAVPVMAGSQDVADHVQKNIGVNVLKRFEHEANRLLDGVR